jgi:D-beta-D-heptose 7-phosphate kinase/D-beta-D-heptose 1-phosphate adenosyltransferase
MDELENKIKKLNVLVVGDIILDKYYYTDVTRISPEAPVPIAKFKSETNILGGAGNVTLNLKKLGVENVYSVGIIGVDNSGKQIQEMFRIEEINFMPIFSYDDTITKTRIISDGKQLLRLDFEKDFNSYADLSKKIISEISLIISKIDIVIVSDYVKGCIRKEVLDYLKTTGIFLVADTKSTDIENFSDFNLITPNFTELSKIAEKLGFDGQIENTNLCIESVGGFVKNKLNSTLLITRSEMGVSLVDSDLNHCNIEKAKVFDVTGAGDTCASIFSCLYFLGHDKKSSLELMNAAARLTVSNVGNYAPTFYEIKDEFLKEEFDYLLTRDAAIKKMTELKSEGKKIVFTNGCFDILHKGHISYLTEAKAQGDVLIVVLISDASVRSLKGETRPIIDENSRSFVMSNLKDVDFVVIFDEQTPCEIIDALRPDIHVKGGDYKKGDMPETKIVEAYGGEVRILKFIDNNSTSKIIEKIRKYG